MGPCRKIFERPFDKTWLVLYDLTLDLINYYWLCTTTFNELNDKIKQTRSKQEDQWQWLQHGWKRFRYNTESMSKLLQGGNQLQGDGVINWSLIYIPNWYQYLSFEPEMAFYISEYLALMLNTTGSGSYILYYCFEISELIHNIAYFKLIDTYLWTFIAKGRIFVRLL